MLSWMNDKIRTLKAPRMIWGYNDKKRTRVSDTASLYHPERISVADNVFIGHHTILDGTDRIEIGEGAQISAQAVILTHSSHRSIRLLGRHYTEIPEDEKVGYERAPVKIGRYAFLGVGCVILPGVSIGDGAVVASCALVTKDVHPFSIVSGVPAKVTGDTRDGDEPYLSDPRIAEWYREWQEDQED